MLESQIVEIDGTFLGALILEADRKTRRFYAAHDSVRTFHNHTVSAAGGGFEKPPGFEVCSVIPFVRFWLREWRYEAVWFL